MVKNLPANAGEMQVWSLGQDDPLEKGMATHSSILAWNSPWKWTEETDSSRGGKEMQLKRPSMWVHIFLHWQYEVKKVEVYG